MRQEWWALVAEDNVTFREQIVELLAPLSIACVEATNGREAIAVLRDLSRELHLLVTDMEMPLHDGWEVIRAARQARGHKLPIIMQTGQTQFATCRSGRRSWASSSSTRSTCGRAWRRRCAGRWGCEGALA